MKQTFLIEVDSNDNAVGIVEKMSAHRNGILHRAFSVFIFNPEGKWLLQKRSDTKYHSAGLWTNTCCGHPLPGEQTQEAARSRLKYEMGLDCELKEIFSFMYHARLENELAEHEYDHVFFGFSSNLPVVNREEVSQWREVSIHELRNEIMAGEKKFTEWFKMIFERVQSYYELDQRK